MADDNLILKRGSATGVVLFVLIGAAWWLLMDIASRRHSVLPATAHHRMP